MSHDFAFWDIDEPLESDEASAIYAALAKTGTSARVRPSPKIALLAREIESRWPVPGPGLEDDWPLAAQPDVSEAHLIVGIVPSRLWDVWPVLGQFAKEHELVMYDPQQHHVFRGCPGSGPAPGPRRSAPATHEESKVQLRLSRRTIRNSRRRASSANSPTDRACTRISSANLSVSSWPICVAM
jgi:hypothetical protein